jgi:hypothetical protein
VRLQDWLFLELVHSLPVWLEFEASMVTSSLTGASLVADQFWGYAWACR